mmetsp:Transcript_23185/g.32420  ORF Transcript_23185/g.32420 Transcript_23185/m.32420 type:complete len:307 (-) Transcript_23185:978-1898(-)
MPPPRARLFVRVGDGARDHDSKNDSKKRKYRGRPHSLATIEPGVDSDREDYDESSQDESLIETALEHGYFVLIEHALASLDQNVGTLSGFLNTTEGRDKLIKVIQYGSRAFIYLQGGSGLISTDFERRLVGFTSSCSIVRKFLKLGMQMTLVRMCQRVIRNDIIGRYVDLYNRVYYSRGRGLLAQNRRCTNDADDAVGEGKEHAHTRTKDALQQKNVNFGKPESNGGGGRGKRSNTAARRSPSFYELVQPFSHKMRRKVWANIPATLLFLSTRKVRSMGMLLMLLGSCLVSPALPSTCPVVLSLFF